MKPEKSSSSQTQFLAPTLREMLDPQNPLYKLSVKIDWKEIEAELSPLYADFERPTKSIRLMVGFNLLKHMFNLGDETVIKAWVENPYYQFFTGETVFQWKRPVAPSDMVYFRKRIGMAGLERILAASIQIHGESAKEEEVIVDTTVQEKNITHPTDVKLYSRVIEYCWRIADEEGIALRQRYTRVRKKCLYMQRCRKSKVRFKNAIWAEKKLKVIVGRLTQELLKKISSSRFKRYAADFDTFSQIIHQKKTDANKVYSVHEPDVQCISKEISGSKRYRLKQKLHRRASIEPRIGRLKARFRLGRVTSRGCSGTWPTSSWRPRR